MNKQDYEDKKAEEKSARERKRPRKVLRRQDDGSYK